MAKDTKEKITDAALAVFAQKGYAGTNIRELAEACGLTKSAIYKHYESKEALWNTMLDKVEAYYNERFGSEEKLPPVPESGDDLLALTLQMVNFTLHDKKIILTRRILQAEQFHNEKARMLATKHFNTAPQAIFTELFSQMMQKGIFFTGDAGLLAFSFTAPISSLILLCDREPEREPEVLETLTAFVRQFAETYFLK